MKLFLSLVVMGFGILVGGAENLKVVPAVKSWVAGEGVVRVKTAGKGRFSWSVEKGQSKRLDDFSSLLMGEMPWMAGGEEKEGVEAGSVHFKLNESVQHAEGYRITIKGEVLVEASSVKGLFYGSRTVLQLMASYPEGVPCGVIEDAPKYEVRSLMLDVGRKFISVDGLKDWIRMMGYFKFNQLQLHLNDNSWGRYPGYRLESKVYPGLASKDGHYTFAEIRALQDFSKGYGVEIVPEIDSPGHSLAFTMYRPDLAHPEINREGFGLAYLDLRNPDSMVFMKKLMDEVVPLFDSKEFHIGTDEYRLNLVKDGKQRAELGELFRKYINDLGGYVREKHGKTVRIWSGYEHMPGKTEPHKDTVIDMWVTGDAKNKTKAGYKVINSSHGFTYIVPGAPYYGVNNRNIYENWTPLIFENKPAGKLDEGEPNLLGAKLHVWNDFGPTGYTWNEIARLTLPSIAAFGEKMWGTQGVKSYGEFTKYADGLDRVPGVKLLDRDAGEDFVWEMDEGREMIANNSLEIDSKSDNLEWPWTASFTVTRKNDIAGDEVLVSSGLAAFYLDLKYDFKSKQGVETKRGVACVRANQAPGFDALGSYNPDVLVFPYEVPLNEQVKLTFVGELRKTSLYVNGKLISTIRKQMVCPLVRVGADALPRGFHGTLHGVTIVGKVAGRETVGAWEPKGFVDGEQVLEFGLPSLRGDLVFEYQRGLNGVDIVRVELLQGGKVFKVLGEEGFAGGNPRGNSFLLPDGLEGEVRVRAVLRGAGGVDSRGEVILRGAL